MVCSGPNGPRAENIAIGDRCRGDNPNGAIDYSRCAAMQPQALYRVAVNDYIAAGGSGFEVLKRNTTKQDTGVSLRDGLRTFLNTRTTCLDQIDSQVEPPMLVTQRYGAISCLDETVEAHDGRIRPVFK